MSEYHEPFEALSPQTRDMHRAIKSLMEELEAVDWYQQRFDVTPDADLKAVLAHNRDEEIEHACMMLEWIRRHMPKFDEELRTYLFKDAPITEIEELEERRPFGALTDGAPQVRPVEAAIEQHRSLGIGSLHERSRQ